MVSFSCENCGDVLTKKKLDPHRNRCRGATFTCIDCMVHFVGTEYRAHTSCITEEQKYQGNLYKNKKVKIAPSTPAIGTPSASEAETQTKAIMPQKAFVEDVPEAEFEGYEDFETDDESRSPAEPLPEAPTPPPAPEVVNVFDFLVANNTPNASNANLPGQLEAANEETQLVRFDYDSNAYVGPEGFMVDGQHMVQYGTGPVPGHGLKTPANKVHRKKTKETTEVKTDKKRKRLHVETDQVMTDAPPVLHSGLTGGLNRLMKPIFPPSPDYSGGDVDPSPASPLKKTKHSKHHKSNGIGNNLLALMTSGSKTKTKKRKVSTKKHSRKSKTEEKQLAAPPMQKLIEYRPGSSDSKKEGESNNQMVVYRPRADLFFSFVKEESERGCSVNKALKRFHRERNTAGDGLGKLMEEKELWRTLRMKRNDRGEIVLFCV